MSRPRLNQLSGLAGVVSSIVDPTGFRLYRFFWRPAGASGGGDHDRAHFARFEHYRHFNRVFWTERRIAGILLIAGLLIGLLAVVIMIASGTSPGFAAVGGALELMTPYADTFRLLNGMYANAWVALLLGMVLLTRLLARAGDEQLALLAFTLILITAVTGVIHGTFHVGLTTWAAEEAGRTGSVPEIYQPLRAWVGGAFSLGYAGSFVAMVLIGWGSLRTGLLASGLGWVVIGWSVLWLTAFLLRLGGAPAIPFITPALIGIALVLEPSKVQNESDGNS